MQHQEYFYPASAAWLLDSSLRRWIEPPKQFIEKLEITSEMTLVDFGCGPGYFTASSQKHPPLKRSDRFLM